MTKPKRRQGNPTDSAWYSTPNAARGRKRVELTLPPETIAALEALALGEGVSKSAMIEALIGAEVARRPKRRSK